MPPKVFPVMNVHREATQVSFRLGYIAAMNSQEAEAVWLEEHRHILASADAINNFQPSTTVAEAYILTDEFALQSTFSSAPVETMSLAAFEAWKARIARGPVFDDEAGEITTPGWRRITTAMEA